MEDREGIRLPGIGSKPQTLSPARGQVDASSFGNHDRVLDDTVPFQQADMDPPTAQQNPHPFAEP